MWWKGKCVKVPIWSFVSDWTWLFYRNSIKINWNLIGQDYNPIKDYPFCLVEWTHSSWRYPSILTKNHFFFNLTTSSHSSKYLKFKLTNVNYFCRNCNFSFFSEWSTYSIFCNLLLKMIFSVQNTNLMFSVEIFADLVQNQVRVTVFWTFSGTNGLPIEVWQMMEVMRRVFNDHHITQVPMTENQLG